jgi:dsRNA-specific ribonuclease
MSKDPSELIKHIDTFFGVRNGIKGEPIENVNYTIETLTYMTPHNRADEITQMIVDRMDSMGYTAPHGLFECCAGMGGNTLSFLEHPAIKWVVSYEINPDRREMLRRNINMYQMGAKSYVQDEAFNGIPDSHKDVVLYFDPPWLPDDIPGDKSSEADYLLEGIKIGDKTLEQWIAECRNCAMVVMRVPPNYKLKPIPNFDIEEIKIRKSLLIFVTPRSLQPKKSLAITRSVLPEGVEESEREWYEGLRGFIYNLLSMIIPDPNAREAMVSDEAMKVWVPCFTHESYDRNMGSNYEELELVGDHAMEYNFMMYLYLSNKGYNRSQLSELKSNYMSKPYQAKIGQKFGLGHWVRIVTALNTHVFEDLLEAFFGGLNIVGDKVFKFGAGNGLCFNMILKIFENVELNKEKAVSKPKSKIKELFETLPWGPQGVSKEEWKAGAKPVTEIMKNDDGSFTVTISYTPEALQWLLTMGINVPPLLSTATGSTETVAFEEGYKLALDKIRGLGITDDWIKQWRKTRDWSKPELAVYIEAIQNKTKAEGYNRFFIDKASKPGKDKKIQYQLIGVLPNGRMKVLSTTPPTSNVMEGKQQALEIYLQK